MKKHCSDTEHATHSLSQEVASTVTPDANSPSVPDGGFLAWLQCAGSFLLFFNSWGIVNTFGAYQTFYTSDSSFLNKSASDISWIGSIQAFLLVLGSVIAGPLYDRGWLRTLLCAGSSLVVFGMIMTSICNQYWQLVLAQGLVVGAGNGCLFIPSIAVLPAYFERRRALALGIAAAGSSVGGVLYPITFSKLQPRIGFGWATRIVAFIMLGSLMTPLLGLKMRNRPNTCRKFMDLHVFTETPFALFGAATFIGFLGLYIPFFYIQVYATDNLSLNKNLTLYLLPLLNAGSFFGRLVLGYTADQIGSINTLIPCTMVVAVLAFVWLSIKSWGGVIAFCLLYGFLSGAFVSLNPAVITSLCRNTNEVGSWLGMICIPLSIGLLLGNPIAGAILRHGWPGLQVFCGVCNVTAALFVVGTRIAKNGVMVKVKS